MFKNSKILITGGTGSFGSTSISHFIKLKPKEIIIFSRDEKKQDDLRRLWSNYNNISFHIGDVRDVNSLIKATYNVDYIFHAAALKQVPSCEFFPYEALSTNVIGAKNVIEACKVNNVKKACFLSTDKAVYPINAMGISKAMAEKLIIAESLDPALKTKLSIVRYGNVISSRGSVVPLFNNQIINNKPITITNPEMTRFLLSLNDAISLVKTALSKNHSGVIYVKKAPSAKVIDIAKSLLKIHKKNNKINIIGVRPGEKMHETLISEEESFYSHEFSEYFMIDNNLTSSNFKDFYSSGTKVKSFSYVSSDKKNLIQNKNLENIIHFSKNILSE
jgi:UDP-N-acetylglucosamine 4,6-dehydratase/5-epimerase